MNKLMINRFDFSFFIFALMLHIGLFINPLSSHAADAIVPGGVVTDCPVCPEMVVLPTGEFVMGSDKVESGHQDEKPQHTVKIAKSIAVSKFETTFALWDACTAEGKCPKADDGGFGRGNFPAINVSWIDAKAYTSWLAAKTGKPYRLLSEAEYEYAVRGGTKTAWFWGGAEDKKKTCEFANLHDETSKAVHPNYVWSHVLCEDGAAENAPVGKYKPNPFGLHDMHGNLREWVEDCHQLGYKGAPEDGSVRAHEGECEKRVVRGGGWMDGPATARSAYRYSEQENFRNYQVGFRVVVDLK
jgi:formylglycine-generating enzyme required for sulfatase activity